MLFYFKFIFFFFFFFNDTATTEIYTLSLHDALPICPAGDYAEESWSATATTAEFLAEFAGWDPRVTDLIQAGGTPGRWALIDRAPLKRWSTARITLLGDAAHPMFPF